MQIIPPSDTPENDGVSYVLLNTLELFTLGKNHFMVGYGRGDDVETKTVSITNVESLKPGLSNMLMEFVSNTSPQTHREIRATVANLLGCFVKLNDDSFKTLSYSHLSNIKKIKTTGTPNFFEVEGIFYNVGQLNTHGIATVEICPQTQVIVPGSILDGIWPGASKMVLTMESLGYSDDAILQALYTSCSTSLMANDGTLPNADLSA